MIEYTRDKIEAIVELILFFIMFVPFIIVMTLY